MASQADPPPAAATPLAAFRQGLAAPWDGFRYMSRHPSLWRFGLLPVLLNLLITLFVFVLLAGAAVAFAVYLHPKFPQSALGVVLEILCGIGLFIVVVAAAVAAWMLFQGILCGHYHGKLALEVELQLGTRREDLKEIEFRYQVVDSLRDLAGLAAVNAACLLANIVPVLGSILGLCGALYYDCYLFGTDYLDFPLALRGLRRSEKRAFTRRHRAHTLGLGAAILLLSFVPVLGAVLLTTAATGAVLLHDRLQQANRLSDARRR